MTSNNTSNKREFRFLIPVAGMFVASLLIANTTTGKFIQLGPFVFPGGIIIFPVSYIFGDILTEVYGYARSRRIIWTGFAANLLAAFVYWAVIQLPAPPFWTDQEAIVKILGQVPRVVVASIIGYLAGEFTNSLVMAKMKLWTKGRFLWTRTISSTALGQAVDTCLFILIAFLGVFPGWELVRTVLSFYVFKVSYEILATPLTYVIVGYLKKAEGFDHYDTDTNFSPFRW